MYAVFKVHSMFTQLNSLTFVKVRELPRTKFKLRLRLAFIQLLSANGDGEIRTLDPLLARQVLSQLSYAPILMGLSGLEPPTSRLSGVRSNRLSYKPIYSGSHLLSRAVSSKVPSAA